MKMDREKGLARLRELGDLMYRYELKNKGQIRSNMTDSEMKDAATSEKQL